MKAKALLAILLGVGICAGDTVSLTSFLQKRRIDPVAI